MAQLRSRRSSRRRRKSTVSSGFLWLLAGIAVGLGIAIVAWLGNAPDEDARQPAQAPAPAAALAPVTRPAPAATPAPGPDSSESERFQFYDLLPRQEVVVPGRDQPAQRDGLPATSAPAGTQYVLQAGSFSRYPDADRVKAQLALIGINATVQPVTVDGIEYHRVRIGPISDPNELDRLRSRLRQEKIDAVVLRVTD